MKYTHIIRFCIFFFSLIFLNIYLFYVVWVVNVTFMIVFCNIQVSLCNICDIIGNVLEYGLFLLSVHL